ncbi:MAG: Gfo/Idh/MocA family oxidoreductase [Armatimonadetes bacterium]|nr:Gfo/Idh/MocA family oxidoreductase [Armatimonadota bacterium]
MLRGASALALVPTVVRAQETGRPKPSERLQAAMVGCGGQGMGNLRSFLGQPEVQVVAVCDVDRKHAADAKAAVDKRYGNADCAAYTDFRELLDRGGIDIMMTALPDHWHAIPAIRAVRQGIDIYGEKPFTHTLAEGRALADTVREYGRIWQTGSWQRSQANFRTACELVRNGRLGKVVRIEIGLPAGSKCGPVKFGEPPAELDYDLWLGPSPSTPYCRERVHYNWRHQLIYGGGKLMDWIGHHGDIAHWGMGWDETGPVAVEATATWPEGGIYDAPLTYHIQATYEGGVEMHIANSGNQKIRSGTVWYGENGNWIWVDRGRLEASPQTLLTEPLDADAVRLYYSTNHLRNFLECVKTRQPAITPAETAHRSASIGHLGNIALRLGRKIRWNPATEEILDDPSASRLLATPQRAPWHL